ncbi:hypothetical protein HOP50_11g64280 [Chloropicon primus]|nr:hypothetical protein HOP50_11g64280 [Chloropicon primus]
MRTTLAYIVLGLLAVSSASASDDWWGYRRHSRGYKKPSWTKPRYHADTSVSGYGGAEASSKSPEGFAASASLDLGTAGATESASGTITGHMAYAAAAPAFTASEAGGMVHAVSHNKKGYTETSTGDYAEASQGAGQRPQLLREGARGHSSGGRERGYNAHAKGDGHFHTNAHGEITLSMGGQSSKAKVIPEGLFRPNLALAEANAGGSSFEGHDRHSLMRARHFLADQMADIFMRAGPISFERDFPVNDTLYVEFREG